MHNATVLSNTCTGHRRNDFVNIFLYAILYRTTDSLFSQPTVTFKLMRTSFWYFQNKNI